jgi:hypothetical protein
MNMNRIAINIAAVLVVAGGFMGYRLYKAETQKEAIIKEYESYKEDQATKLSAAEKALREDEVRITHEIKKADEAGQLLKAEEQRRVAAEEQLRHLEAARKATGGQEPSRVYEDRQHMPVVGQATPDQQPNQAQLGVFQSPQTMARASEPDGRTITVKTRIDASSATQVPLARVHAGDQVTVRVQRVGQAHRQLMVGLGPAVRDSTGKFAHGLLGGRRTVSKRIKDQDRFMVSFDLLSMGGGRFKLNTQHGAILYIGAEVFRSSYAESGESGGAGYYDIELMIRQHNRWDIVPESLT